MATAVFTSFEQLMDNNGNPLNGGSVTVYQATSTTPISLFSNVGLSTPASNPIVLDIYGRHAITYFANQSYKVLIKDSGGSTLTTIDNIDPGIPIGTGALGIANGGTGATSAPTALANLGGATAAELADVAADVAGIVGALSSTEKTHLATGTTGQRPAVPAEGDVRSNSSTFHLEWFDSDDWRAIATFPYTTFFTVQKFTSGSGTYTKPDNVKWIRVRMVGGGGGGGAASANAGSVGGDTSFESWTAIHGNGGGVNGAAGGAGGTGGATGTGTEIVRLTGAAGNSGAATGTGAGGGSFFGGAGSTPIINAAGNTAKANTGSGGSGGCNSGNAGAGGGAGEYVEFFISVVGASYSYAVGAGGNGGTAGGQAGGAGAAGIIIVEEYYIG